MFCLCHGFLSVVVMTLLYCGKEGKENDSDCHCSIRIYIFSSNAGKSQRLCYSFDAAGGVRKINSRW